MRLYLVAGMHRSGTSLLTMLLSILGAEVGPEDRLIGASASNPTGHWELRPVVELNDRILAALGGSWDAPPPLLEGWQHDERLRGLRTQARQIISGHLSEGLNVIKDPRLSILAPFWQELVPVHGTIVMLRSPAEVAASLARRNGLDSEASAELWLRYTLDAIALCSHPHVLSYEDLLNDRREEAISHVVELLDLPKPDEEQLAAVTEAVRRDLRHHAGSPPLEGTAGSASEALYEQLRQLGVAGVGDLGPALRQRSHLLSQAAALRSALDKRAAEVRRERARSIDASRSALSFRALHLESQRDAARLRREVQLLRQQAIRAKRKQETLETHIGHLEERLDGRDVQLQRLREELESTRLRAARHERRSSELALRVQEQERELSELRATAERVHELEEGYRRLRTRRSVRLLLALSGALKPLRKLLRR